MPPRRPYVYKRKGRAGYTVFDPNARAGQQRTHVRPRKNEADDLAEELYRRAVVGDGLEPDELLRDYAVRWMRHARHGLAPGTARGYASAFDQHIIPALGHLRLRQITRTQVKDFVAGKLDAGLAKSTVANIRGTLHVALEDAREDGLIPENPVSYKSRRKSLRLTPTKAERRQNVLAFTREELALFLDTARAKKADWWLMFRLIALTGLRIGEALVLKWPDVDWGKRQLHVERGWTRHGIRPTKTGLERDVDLAAGLIAELRRHDVATKAAALAGGVDRPAWIFSSRAGTPLDYNYARGAFKSVLAFARLPLRYGPHSLRHTFASLLLSAGESVYYVQRQLGHSDIRMTVDRYGSWLPAGNLESVDRLEASLSRDMSRTQEKQGAQ